MRQTIFLALALSLIFTVNAQYDYEATSFSEAPVQVLTATTDAANYEIPFVSRFINDTYIALWGFYGDGDTAPITYNAVRRLFNATDLTVVGTDSNVTLNLTYQSQPLIASSTDGFVAVAGVVSTSVTTNTTNATTNITSNSTTTTLSVQVTVYSSDTDESNETETVQIDASTNTTLNYTIFQLWFQDNYFYVLYGESVNNVETNLLLQGFKRDGGNLQFSTSQQINVNPLSGNVQAQVAQQGSTIVVSYRYDTQGQVAVNTITTGGSLGSEATIATDAGTNEFAPAAVVYAEDYYVVVLSQTANGLTSGFSVSYSGSNQTTSLGFALDTGFNTYSISASSPYFDGWFVITRQSKLNGNTVTASEETIQIYNYTQTITTTSNASNTTNSTNGTNGTNGSNATTTTTTTTTSTAPIQETLLTDGSVIQGFTLPNQSYYVFILDSETGETGQWTAGYLGQVFSSIDDSSFGSAMKAALTVVSAVVALLFVF